MNYLILAKERTSGQRGYHEESGAVNDVDLALVDKIDVPAHLSILQNLLKVCVNLHVEIAHDVSDEVSIETSVSQLFLRGARVKEMTESVDLVFLRCVDQLSFQLGWQLFEVERSACILGRVNEFLGRL